MGEQGSIDSPGVGRFEAVFENAFDAIVIADDDGQYVDVNPAACELFGLSREELVGRSIEEFAAEDYAYSTEWEAFHEEGTPRGVFPLRRPDGEVRIVEYAASRDIRSGEHLSILRDVTERVEREEQLQRQLDRLDQFASVVSHDLRTPLAVAAGRLDLLRETGEEAHYEAAQEAIETIDDITTELLALARDEGREAERESLSLGAVARDVWADTDPREAALEVASDPTLSANRQQLRMLLSNLFRNAVGHGGFDVTVRVGGLSDGFYVEDTGAGIPAGERERVLESGYSTGYGGSGIGLTIVQQVASAHGWEVDVGEGGEGGARFSFRTGS